MGETDITEPRLERVSVADGIVLVVLIVVAVGRYAGVVVILSPVMG